MARHGIGDRFGHRRYRRFVKDTIHAPADLDDPLVVVYVEFVELDIPEQPLEVFALACFEVIDRAHPFASLEQRANEGGPDEAGGAGDEVGGHICWESYRPGAAPGQCRRGTDPRTYGAASTSERKAEEGSMPCC